MTNESLPKISVLIHNRNRAGCLARCLETVARQDARPLEVVVLDAQSTDDSSKVLTNHKLALESVGIHVVVVSCEPAGVPASRNLASSHATGELLFFLDNDATLDRPNTASWLQRYFKRHEELGLVGCQILARDSDSEDPFCWVYRRSARQWRKTPFDTFTFAGAGFCVRASAYKECAGFWEVIDYSREEEALSLRLLDHGWRVAYRPEAVVRHYPDPRGRRSLIERRAIELKNGVLIYWHAYPRGLGFLFSLLRAASMSLRALLRREGSLRTLLAGWGDARRCWHEIGLHREPVAWRTMFRLLRLHFSRGSTDANGS